MIGIDQEPSRKVLDALNEGIGEGKYAIAYSQDANGVIGIIRTRDNPPREFTTRFAIGAAPVQVEAVWLELADRTSKTLQHEREQAEFTASQYRSSESADARQEELYRKILNSEISATPEMFEAAKRWQLTLQAPGSSAPSGMNEDDEALARRIASRPNAEGTPDGTTYAEPDDGKESQDVTESVPLEEPDEQPNAHPSR